MPCSGRSTPRWPTATPPRTCSAASPTRWSPFFTAPQVRRRRGPDGLLDATPSPAQWHLLADEHSRLGAGECPGWRHECSTASARSTPRPCSAQCPSRCAWPATANSSRPKQPAYAAVDLWATR